MSKVAKTIAAVVVTVAAVVTLNPQLISAAIAMDTALIVDAVVPKPKITSAGQETAWSADPRDGIPYAVGRCAVAGSQAFMRSAGSSNKYRNYVSLYTATGSTTIGGFDAFLANDVAVTYSADGGEGAAGYYQNRMWMKRQLGAAHEPYLHWTATGSKDTPADHGGMPAEWTASHQLSGYAASLWGLEWDTAKYAGGVPGPKMVGRWVKVYDPRKDSTYPGGSGPHRYADPSNKAAYIAAAATWEWSANPYLHGLMWALGRWTGDPNYPAMPLVKTHGLGAPMSSIDVASFVEGSNVATANNWTLGGRVKSTDDKWEVLKSFLEAGGGEPILLGHKLACMVNAPKVSLATLTKADAVGDVSVAGSVAIESRINTVWPSYTEETLNWTVVPFDQPVQVAAYLGPDKGERSVEMALPLVQSPVQMAQLARYRIEDSRELTPIAIPAKPWTMWLRPGDCITVNEPEWGLINRKLLIMQRKRDPATMKVTFICRTETDAKHAFALGQTATAPDTPSLTGIDANIVPPPAADAWTIVGGQVAGASGSLPAIIIAGEAELYDAVTIVVDYREVLATVPVTYGEWQSASFPASAKTLVVQGLKPGARYQVRVRYITALGTENPGSNTDLGEVIVGGNNAGTVGGKTYSQIIADAEAAVSGDIAAVQALAQLARDEAEAAHDEAEDALADVAAEVARAQAAEDTLSLSIVSLTSTVGANTSAISAEALTRSTADSALSAQITSLTSTVGANRASADSSIATLTTATNATAARTSVLEAKAVAVPNLIKNSDGKDPTPLRFWTNGAGATVGYNSISGSHFIIPANGSGSTRYLVSDVYGALPGSPISLSLYGDANGNMGSNRASVYVQFVNAGGAVVDSPVLVPVDGATISWTKPLEIPNRVPVGGTVTGFQFVYAVPPGHGGSFFSRVMVNTGAVCVPYNDLATARDSLARLNSEEITRASADSALSASITSLTSTVGANKASADSSILTLTTATNAMSARTSVLEGKVISRANLTTNGSGENGLTGLTFGNCTGAPFDGARGRSIVVTPTAGSTSCVVNFPSFVAPAGESFVVAADLSHIVTDGLGFAYVDLIFLDAGGSVVLDGPQNPRSGSFTFSDDDTTRSTVAVAATAPAGSARALARAVFAYTSPATVTSLGVRQLKAERGTLPATPYTADATDIATNARISAEEITRASADSALSASITSLTATVGGNTSAISNEAITRANADTALAVRAGVLEALTRPGSPNRLLNGDFSDGFRYWISSTGSFVGWGYGVDANRGSMAIASSGAAGLYIYQDTPASPGIGYSISAEGDFVGSGNAHFQFLNAAKNTVLGGSAAVVPTGWSNPRSASPVVTAPAGTAYMRAIVQRTVANNIFGFTRLQVQEGAATAWRDDATSGTTSARLSTEEVVRSNETSALSSSLTSLSASVGGNTASISTQALALANVEGNLAAFYGFKLDVAGKVTGMRAANDGPGGAPDVIEFDSDTVIFNGNVEFNGSVTSEALRAGAVLVNRRVSYTPGTPAAPTLTFHNVGASDTDLCTLTQEFSGRDLEIDVISMPQYSSGSLVFTFGLYYDGTLIKKWPMAFSNTTIPHWFNGKFFHTPTPGTHTYKFSLLNAGTSSTVAIGERTLSAREMTGGYSVDLSGGSHA